MLEVVLLRATLAVLPFAAWFAWAAWARRTGRDPVRTPWAWLMAAGAMLVALSLFATALFHRDNRGQEYVPGEVGADGRVIDGRYQDKASPNP